LNFVEPGWRAEIFRRKKAFSSGAIILRYGGGAEHRTWDGIGTCAKPAAARAMTG
jgi:hypothetical protein